MNSKPTIELFGFMKLFLFAGFIYGGAWFSGFSIREIIGLCLITVGMCIGTMRYKECYPDEEC